MQRILAIVIGVALLAGLAPATTCLGKESCRGTARCCCAQPEPEAALSSNPEPAASPAPSPPPPSAALRRGCPCPPEVRQGPTEPSPSTLPAAPARVVHAAIALLQPSLLGDTILLARPSADLAEPPPVPSAARPAVLRL